MSKLLDLWYKWTTQGIRLPYLYDPVTKKPSITILFPYITFTISVISVILLHFYTSMLAATITSIAFWAISTIFYMMRKLQKSKFNVKDGSFELESGSE